MELNILHPLQQSHPIFQNQKASYPSQKPRSFIQCSHSIPSFASYACIHIFHHQYSLSCLNFAFSIILKCILSSVTVLNSSPCLIVLPVMSNSGCCHQSGFSDHKFASRDLNISGVSFCLQNISQ